MYNPSFGMTKVDPHPLPPDLRQSSPILATQQARDVVAIEKSAVSCDQSPEGQFCGNIIQFTLPHKR